MTLFTRRGDQGAFDQLFAWVDALRAAGRYPYGLEELVFAIEGTVQDINDSNVESAVTRKLGFWFEIASSNDDDNDAIESFQIAAIDLLRLLSFWRQTDTKSLVSEINSVGVSPPDAWTPRAPNHPEELDDETKMALMQHLLTMKSAIKRSDHGESRQIKALVDTMKESSDSISISEMVSKFFLTISGALVEDSTSKGIPVRISRDPDGSREDVIANARSTWLIRIKYLNTELSAADIGRSIWSISAALESVPGVAVRVEGWGHGSLWTKLRIWLRNVWARDEVREVLEKGRNAAVAHYLDKPTEEAKKLQAEREKLEHERELLKQNIASGSPELAKRLLELEVLTKEQELKSKQLDNSLKALEFVERASILAKDGIIVADKVQIDINELAYFLFDGKQVMRGESLQRIESNEEVLRPDDIPTSENDPGA